MTSDQLPRPTDDELVARPQHDEVIEHDIAGAHLDVGSVAAHDRLRLADDGELGQGPGGPPLLDDADAGVGHDDEAEQRVLDRRHQQHDQP